MFLLILLYNIVSVELFTKYNIKDIHITKENNQKIKIKNISNTIVIDNIPKDNIFIKNNFNGTLSINNGQKKRKYKGDLKIIVLNKKLKVFLKLPIDDYTASVTASEMNKILPDEALKAFYLVVKSYTLSNQKRHKNSDFCDLAHCQLFYGDTQKSKVVKEKIEYIKNKKLSYKNKAPRTYYSAICGPARTSSKTIWGKDIPYLRGGVNIYNKSYIAKNHQAYKWEFKITKKELENKTGIKDIFLYYDEFNYVKKVKTQNNEYSGENFRRIIGHKFGWNKLKSNIFILKKTDNSYIFNGYGLGHGVGFCIEEAAYLAQKGLKYNEIIKFFFSDIEIK